jgi:hypothetical protein
MTDHRHFHISYFPPNDGWPQGGYALYEINGDEIARRIGFDNVGNVNRRDSWPGYIGTYDHMDRVAVAIRERSE